MRDMKTTYDATTKVWSGIAAPSHYGKDYSIGKAALEAMLKNPAKIGQICYHNDKRYTNKELATLTIAVANHFTKLGVKQCDMIGLCASNTDFIAPLFFGAMLKGLIVSSQGVSYDQGDIEHTFGITKPKLMFCDANVYEKVKAALRNIGLNIEIYIIKGHVKGQPNLSEFLTNKPKTLNYDFEPLKMGPSQTATILCSSGSTGPPKGVTMSHEDLINFEELGFASEVYLCFSAIDWISGLFAFMTGTLVGQTRIISDKPFSTADFFDIVPKYGVTMILAPPPQMAVALASPQIETADLSSIQKYLLGGSAASYDMIKHMQKYMPHARFYQVYGLSETRNVIAFGEYSENTGCVGGLCQNLQAKILDDYGQKLGPNEEGEIYFKTACKWLGYYGNEKATAATLDADGWIASGDIGSFDEQCKLHLVDRKKDILKYDGYHYSPTEIEQVIRGIEEVADACVCGLPDLMFGDLPTAAVVRREGSNLTEQDVYDHVAEHLTYYKHLKGGVYFLDKMLLTETGKISRKNVRIHCEKLRNLRI